MRWLVLAAPLLSGCILGALSDSGRDCPAGEPLDDGFRVAVPATVGEGRDEVRTHGYCVSVRAADGDGETTRSVRDGVAWLPADGAGTYRFILSIRQPGDPYCAYWLEAEAEHPGTGVVEVALSHDGVSVCA